MPDNLFSIIIPCYNYASYLPRAINSAINQSGDDFDIIIIDDGSTDNTKELVNRFLAKNDKLRYFYQVNKGAAAARNLGVKKSSSKYIVFLDADDELLPKTLDFFRLSIFKHPNKHIYLGGHKSINCRGKVQEKINNTLGLTTKEELFEAYLFKKLSISAGAYAMDYTIFHKLSFPEELSSTEDIPFIAQALALFDTCFIPHVLVTIHKHNDSLRHDFQATNKVGTDLVDILFNTEMLPESCMRYRHQYYLKRCLSLSGLAYRAKRYSQAQEWYVRAITFDKKALLNFSRFKRFFISYFLKDG